MGRNGGRPSQEGMLRGITVDLATIISDFFPNEWREEARNIQ